jgi:multidrug efflux pump subunit AcrA (membrane-fusion protein)
VEAQRAAVAQAGERRSYAQVASPINGVVLEASEPGNLVQPGGEIVKLGDLSQVKVIVYISDSEGSNIRVGQSVPVKLDAFPKESFSGRVSRILPTASTIQLRIEITIPNSNGQIISGLFARVIVESRTARVIVPQSALQEGSQESRSRSQESEVGNNPNSKIQNPKSSEATVFVVTGTGSQAKVQARRVQVGDRDNSKVEIISGLKPGERFVARSGKPLKDGAPVRLSALSET